MICGASFTSANPWLAAFTELREAYSHPEPRKDYTGEQKLSEIGLFLNERVVATYDVTLSENGLTKHALSYGRSADLIRADFDKFSLRVADIVAPYLNGKQLRAKARSWALIYKRLEP